MGSLAEGVFLGGGVASTGGDPAARAAPCVGRGLRGGGSAWKDPVFGLFPTTFDAVIDFASSLRPRVVFCHDKCLGFDAGAFGAGCVTGVCGGSGPWTGGTGGVGTGVPNITLEAHALIAPQKVRRRSRRRDRFAPKAASRCVESDAPEGFCVARAQAGINVRDARTGGALLFSPTPCSCVVLRLQITSSLQQACTE